MQWAVEIADAFAPEYAELDEEVRIELLATMKLLATFGPMLKRPHADTLNGSKHANMKELRFEAANGEWRAAFAFDPDRKAMVVCAGDKSGVSQAKFYKALIAKADKRFDDHLAALKAEKAKKRK
ncbi:MAG TPA: type II toxin-antitoxin system RelE/ParE family toxin [Hyphomonas sp.]|jgi:hypothetical protein|nr:type II toxin-antitoxin system RelE/ParE family toxin [Hyphomonas sp.]